jgi:putative addiction module killer protein
LEAQERSIEYYLLPSGPPAPFGLWRDGIADKTVKAAILARIARMRGGNFSDSRPIGEGASENRIDVGPGYRVYYGIDGDRIILLWGGDKSTQAADIAKAKTFWEDYRKRVKKNAAKRELQGRSARRPPK